MSDSVPSSTLEFMRILRGHMPRREPVILNFPPPKPAALTQVESDIAELVLALHEEAVSCRDMAAKLVKPKQPRFGGNVMLFRRKRGAA